MNNWIRIEPDLWRCFSWDVIYQYGRWHVCTTNGRTIRSFDNMWLAMDFADNFKD